MHGRKKEVHRVGAKNQEDDNLDRGDIPSHLFPALWGIMGRVFKRQSTGKHHAFSLPLPLTGGSEAGV